MGTPPESSGELREIASAWRVTLAAHRVAVDRLMAHAYALEAALQDSHAACERLERALARERGQVVTYLFARARSCDLPGLAIALEDAAVCIRDGEHDVEP
jgi:hypothetical protein